MSGNSQDSSDERKEKRKYPRTKGVLNARIFFIRSGILEINLVKVRNFSPMGMMIVSNDPCEAEQMICFDMDVGKIPGFTKTESDLLGFGGRHFGKIVWVKKSEEPGDFNMGIKFLEKEKMDPDELTGYQKLLNFMKREGY